MYFIKSIQLAIAAFLLVLQYSEADPVYNAQPVQIPVQPVQYYASTPCPPGQYPTAQLVYANNPIAHQVAQPAYHQAAQPAYHQTIQPAQYQYQEQSYFNGQHNGYAGGVLPNHVVV